jgi:glycosyltransferase involved in cell wall biosynthesis
MDALKVGKDDDLLNRILIPQGNEAKPNVWIQITVPNEFQPVGEYNIGVTAGVETTVMPPECLEGMNRMDKVLISSNFGKQCAENTVFDKKDESTQKVVGTLRCEKPVEVLFEGYDTKIYDNKAPSEPRINDTLSKISESFCFLFVGHWLKGDFEQDRKNVSGLIWTFLQAFKGKKNPPALILKTSAGGTSLPDRDRIRKIIKDIRNRLDGRLPNIYLLHSDLTDKEMNALYNHPKVKAHVSFTRGEGFGRPLLEATISGKPMVVSAWSGHMDFLNPEYVSCITGKMDKVHKSASDKFLLKESQWFTIDYSVAGGTMKDIHKNYKPYLEKSRKHRQYTKERFTFEKMVELLDTYLKDVDSKPQTVGLSLPKLKKVNKNVEPPKVSLPKLKKVK